MLFLGFSAITAWGQNPVLTIPIEKPVIPNELLENCNPDSCFAKNTPPSYENCRFHPLPNHLIILGCSVVWRNKQGYGKLQILGLPFDKQGKPLPSQLLPLVFLTTYDSFQSAFALDKWLIELYREGGDEINLINPNAPDVTQGFTSYYMRVLLESKINNLGNSVFTLAEKPVQDYEEITWFTDRFSVELVSLTSNLDDEAGEIVWTYEKDLAQLLGPKTTLSNPDFSDDNSYKFLAPRPEGGVVVYGQTINPYSKDIPSSSFIICLNKLGQEEGVFLLPKVFLEENQLIVKNNGIIQFIQPVGYDGATTVRSPNWQLYSLSKDCNEKNIQKLSLLNFPNHGNSMPVFNQPKGFLAKDNRNYFLYTQRPLGNTDCRMLDNCTSQETEGSFENLPGVYIVETDENGLILKNYTVISPQKFDSLFRKLFENETTLDFEWAFTGDGQSILVMINNKQSVNLDEKKLEQPPTLLLYRVLLNASE